MNSPGLRIRWVSGISVARELVRLLSVLLFRRHNRSVPSLQCADQVKGTPWSRHLRSRKVQWRMHGPVEQKKALKALREVGATMS